MFGVHCCCGTTNCEASARIGPSPHGPPVNASKFWICAEPLSAFTQMHVGRCGSGLTVYRYPRFVKVFGNPVHAAFVEES